MADLSGLGTTFSVGGSLMSGAGAIAEGKAAYELAKYKAAQLRQNAGQARAASQRTAYDVGMNAKLVTSRALALAAAGGGGASDPTVMRIIANTSAQGAYQKSIALYNGEAQASEMEAQAAATMFEGKQAKTAGYIKGLTSVASGVGTGLLAKYGGNGVADVAAT